MSGRCFMDIYFIFVGPLGLCTSNTSSGHPLNTFVLFQIYSRVVIINSFKEISVCVCVCIAKFYNKTVATTFHLNAEIVSLKCGFTYILWKNTI